MPTKKRIGLREISDRIVSTLSPATSHTGRASPEKGRADSAVAIRVKALRLFSIHTNPVSSQRRGCLFLGIAVTPGDAHQQVERAQASPKTQGGGVHIKPPR